MAKLQIYDANGNKTKEISTSIFDNAIREDIVQKIVEVERLDEKQPYAPFLWAGMQTSASGNVKHNRHVWKTDRGKGMSRFPKKRMSDKGERFHWVAAVSPESKGGRRAHPPKVIRRDLKINKKEKMMAFKSALAMVANNDLIKRKYSSLNKTDIKMKLPVIVEAKMIEGKTKGFFEGVKKIFGETILAVGIREKNKAGMLIVTGSKQKNRISCLDSKKTDELKIKDLAENGARLTIFTEEAIKELEAKFK